MNTLSGFHRFDELDACRGVAIIMMVIFHLVFDLSFFSFYPISVHEGFWRIFGYATASLFVLIAGVAISVRMGRTPDSKTFPARIVPFLKRGLYLYGAGLLVTLGTFIILQGEGFVVFGILHLIAIATILSPFFFWLKEYMILPGFLILLLGYMVPLPSGPMWMVWLGIHPSGFFSVDYTPLIPWFGVFLIGMAIGCFLYPSGSRSYQINAEFEHRIHVLASFGRHSLLIYFVHQPVLVAFLGVIYGKIPGIW